MNGYLRWTRGAYIKAGALDLALSLLDQRDLGRRDRDKGRKEQLLDSDVAGVEGAAQAAEGDALGGGVLVEDIEAVFALANEEHIAHLRYESEALERGAGALSRRGELGRRGVGYDGRGGLYSSIRLYSSGGLTSRVRIRSCVRAHSGGGLYSSIWLYSSGGLNS
jgi:hypothetical protein